MRLRGIQVFAGLLLAAGCAAPSKPPHASASAGSPTAASTKANATNAPGVKSGGTGLTITPDSLLAGKIASFNAAGQFVVLNFPVGHLPGIGQRLNVYHLGVKVGEVKVTGPQRDDHIVADVASGQVQAGDEVRDR